MAEEEIAEENVAKEEFHVENNALKSENLACSIAINSCTKQEEDRA